MIGLVFNGSHPEWTTLRDFYLEKITSTGSQREDIISGRRGSYPMRSSLRKPCTLWEVLDVKALHLNSTTRIKGTTPRRSSRGSHFNHLHLERTAPKAIISQKYRTFKAMLSKNSGADRPPVHVCTLSQGCTYGERPAASATTDDPGFPSHCSLSAEEHG